MNYKCSPYVLCALFQAFLLYVKTMCFRRVYFLKVIRAKHVPCYMFHKTKGLDIFVLALAVSGNLALFTERWAANLNCNGLTKKLIEPQSPLIQPWKPSAHSWMLYTCSCFTMVLASSFFRCLSKLVLSFIFFADGKYLGNYPFCFQNPKGTRCLHGFLIHNFLWVHSLTSDTVFMLFMDFLAFVYRTVRRDRKFEGEREKMGWFVHIGFVCFWKTVPFSTKVWL